MTTPGVVAASHHGTLSAGVITWRSHYVFSAPQADATIVFVPSLPFGSTFVARDDTGTPVKDEKGDIIAFAVRQRDASDVVLEIKEHARPLVISPPLSSGDAPQRVSLDGDGDPVFEVGPGLGVVRHVGYAASGDLGHDERTRCDDVLQRYGEPPRSDATYVHATGQLADHGLAGHLTTRGERGHPAAIAALVAFALLVGTLIVLVRRLSQDARVERAEAEVEEAFRDLGATEKP